MVWGNTQTSKDMATWGDGSQYSALLGKAMIKCLRFLPELSSGITSKLRLCLLHEEGWVLPQAVAYGHAQCLIKMIWETKPWFVVCLAAGVELVAFSLTEGSGSSRWETSPFTGKFPTAQAHVTGTAGLTNSASSAWSNCMANIRHSTGTNLLSQKLVLFKQPLRSKYKSILFTTWSQISFGTLIHFHTDVQGKVLKSNLQRFWELWGTRVYFFVFKAKYCTFLRFIYFLGMLTHLKQIMKTRVLLVWKHTEESSLWCYGPSPAKWKCVVKKQFLELHAVALKTL